MHVLYFHQHFTTPSAGGGIRSYEFAKALIRQGHSVTVVCGKTSKIALPETNEKGVFRGNIEGIDVIQLDLPYSNYDGFIKRAWTFIRFGWGCVRIALREKCDLIFATSTPLTAGIPGIVAKIFRKKVPFVFEVRDLWPELPKALGLKNPVLLAGMSVLEWVSYRAADACIGLSPGICEGIRSRSPKSRVIEMIPNGCDLELFHPKFRNSLTLPGVDTGDFTAVFPGAHGMANGLPAVLDAAAELKKRGRKNIKFLFVGDGKMKPALQERARRYRLDNCLFFDPVSKFALREIVASAGAGLMVLKNVPAFYYGTSPNKFFDYIASGIPVLNNYPGWLADNILRTQCGAVVPPDTPVAFADALEKLADNPELCQKYGENGRLLAESEFGREKLAMQFVGFLEKTRERFSKK